MLADRRPEKIGLEPCRGHPVLGGLTGRLPALPPPLEPQASHVGSCDPPVPPTHAHRLGAPPKPS